VKARRSGAGGRSLDRSLDRAWTGQGSWIEEWGDRACVPQVSGIEEDGSWARELAEATSIPSSPVQDGPPPAGVAFQEDATPDVGYRRRREDGSSTEG
jgi:hypothetical protein